MDYGAELPLKAFDSTFARSRCASASPRAPAPQTKAVLKAFKLPDLAQQGWPRVNAPTAVAPVREGVRFNNGNPIKDAA